MKDVLAILMENEYISGEEMSKSLGITRAAVWKQIEKLRSAGIPITSAGKKGYKLEDADDSIFPAYIQNRLNTAYAGKTGMIYEDEMDSTNNVLKKAGREGAPGGTIALCERQTGGKGRLGRGWDSPKGEGIWLSVLLRPVLHPSRAQLLTFVAALAMTKAVENETGAKLSIKWPNDLVLSKKKICGILLEMAADLDEIQYIVIGTGLNTGKNAFSNELREKAISLEEYLGYRPKRAPIIRSYLNELEKAVKAVEKNGLDGILDDYKARSCTLGSQVNVTGTVSVTGLATGIDENGALLITDDKGKTHTVLAGDVSVRGVMGYV